MTAATRRGAVAMLRRLRRLSAVDSRASLHNVWRNASSEVGEAAYAALRESGFYALVRRPAMVRAVDRAIKIVKARP